MSVATAAAALEVIGRCTNPPMREGSRQKRSSGTSANGTPNESMTWLNTSAADAFTPRPSTTSEGTSVIDPRTSNGIERWMKPCVTVWPAIVPTVEEESPEASSAIPKTTVGYSEEAPEPGVHHTEIFSPGDAAGVKDSRGDHQHAEVDQAGDRHRDDHIDAPEAVDPPALQVSLALDPMLGERRVEVDDMRHHGGAEDPDREIDTARSNEARNETSRGSRRRGPGEQDLEREGEHDRRDQPRDHRL